MDVYPPDYLVHNLPLVMLSGLTPSAQDPGQALPNYPLLQENGVRITSDLSPITSPNVGSLLQYFLEVDASHTPWTARTTNKDVAGSIRFRVKVVGRVGQDPFMSPWGIIDLRIKH
jgi:trafficking protein particle complex subunit 11